MRRSLQQTKNDKIKARKIAIAGLVLTAVGITLLISQKHTTATPDTTTTDTNHIGTNSVPTPTNATQQK